ncbi:MAG: glycosyltransferase family 1 protein [Patescibacteria group bacterium]
MKVAFNISPNSTNHKFRGIGVYTLSLQRALKEHSGKEIDIEFFSAIKEPAGFDLIHYPYFDLFFHTLPMQKKTCRVVTIHDVIPLIFPDKFPVGIKGKFNLLLQKRALKNTDAVICDSYQSKKDIQKYLNFPEEKIHVVYLAADKIFTNFRTIPPAIRLKYKLPSKFVLYVGDVNYNKNILNLLDAVKITGVNLVMVGSAIINDKIPQVQEINHKISKLGLQDKITKTGYIPDSELVAIYNLAIVTLVPSLYEGFGLPLVESMSCGTPVIAAKNSSLTEIGGEAAFYCKAEDPTDLANKIKKVVGLNEKELSSIRQKSLKNARKYSWSKTAQETINVYKSAIK